MFRHPLARDIAWLLAFKLAALALIYALFFAPSHRPAIDPDTHIMGSAGPAGSTRR